MGNKLQIGDTDECNYGSGKMTAEHVLEQCPIYADHRNDFIFTHFI